MINVVIFIMLVLRGNFDTINVLFPHQWMLYTYPVTHCYNSLQLKYVHVYSRNNEGYDTLTVDVLHAVVQCMGDQH